MFLFDSLNIQLSRVKSTKNWFPRQLNLSGAGSCLLGISLISTMETARAHGYQTTSIFNILPQRAFAELGVCTSMFSAGGSVSVNLQYCEANAGGKTLERETLWTEHDENVYR